MKLHATLGMLVVGLSLGSCLPGCRRSNPVDEVSIQQSGVEISDISAIAESDWNAWRGPDNDGIAPQQDVATEWDRDTNIRWRTDVPGRGHSSPIVVDQTVFLATAIDDVQEQWVLAYDRSSGTEKWRTMLHQGNFPSGREMHRKGTHANGTLACDGQRLYAGMLNNGAIYATALDLNGEIVWQKELGKFDSKFGYAPSPVLYKSLVIYAADNQGGGYLVAVDGKSGEVAWRVKRGNASSYSSAAVANVGGKDQLLISGDDTLNSYDPASGEEFWSTPCLATSTCGTVVSDGQRVYASGGYPQSETVALDPHGDLVWSDDVKLYEPSLLVVDDLLVGVKDDGIAMAWDAATGDVAWKKRLGGNFSASPILVGDTVYVSNLSGETFVFRAGEKFEAIATNQLGDDCYASPAVSRGDLFLRIGVGEGSSRQEQLVCIGQAQ